MTENQDKPKLIIDEDWKTQVQAEKEALARQRQQAAAGGPASQGQPAGAAPGSAESAARSEAEGPPPASLPVLFTMLASQAMVALGQISDPHEHRAEIHLPEAKYFIDMLAMLEEKTAGQRTRDESRLLENLLYELRLTYVEVQKHVAAAPAGQPQGSPGAPS